MFLAKLRELIGRARVVEEDMDEQPHAASLWSKLKAKCCCCSKKKESSGRFVSSFFTESLFKEIELETSSDDPIKSPSNQKVHSLMGILSLEKEQLAKTGFLVDLECPLQVQIKVTTHTDEGEEVTMLQFIDISD